MVRRSLTSGAFSLAGIFQLITFVCVMLALVGFLIQLNLIPAIVAQTSVAAGAGAGTFFGFLIGLYHHRRTRGISIGIFSGMIFGALIGPLCALGAAGTSLGSPWVATWISMAAGLFLVVLAFGLRQFVVRDPVSKKFDFSQFLEDSTKDSPKDNP